MSALTDLFATCAAMLAALACALWMPLLLALRLAVEGEPLDGAPLRSLRLLQDVALRGRALLVWQGVIAHAGTAVCSAGLLLTSACLRHGLLWGERHQQLQSGVGPPASTHRTHWVAGRAVGHPPFLHGVCEGATERRYLTA